ncbi:ATP-binding protein ['Paenibacillus yunnanensis' Narsing Rao et al. 2020]|uniref:ATP-binding protein n=1 Tax=Paenibacillus tengchongensis TaxID=2608684 RepID=UPI00124D78EB|nr:ATP-binding protein [Paenibacillus tengchongensis]
MRILQSEVKLYGAEHTQRIIDGMIAELDLHEHAFDIRLILAEAITNAHMHGNGGDSAKPILVRYVLDAGWLELQVEDCGPGITGLPIPNEISDDALLNDRGRGLFLIRCFADRVEMRGNIMCISKNISISHTA